MINKKQIEERTCRKDFVTAALSTAGMANTIGENLRILEIGDRDDLFVLLQKEFPGSIVERQKQEKPLEKDVFDYIAAAGLTYLPCGQETDRLFSGWLAYLKPGGLMAAHVCGYSGYYGAVMLGPVIRLLCRGQKPADVIKIVQAILRELPETHPVFKGEIKMGNETTIKELLDLSVAVDHVDKLYTVAKLFEAIPRWGAHFQQWVFPELYEPTPVFSALDPGICRRLNSLPEQRRAVASELLTASPPGHYFLMQKPRN